MTKLKLGPLADDKPIKISIELPAGPMRLVWANARSASPRAWSRVAFKSA